jgi:hypothetical protein
MNARKSLVTIHNSDQEFSLHPEAFVFFDEKTGTQRFDVKVNPKFGGSQGGGNAGGGRANLTYLERRSRGGHQPRNRFPRLNNFAVRGIEIRLREFRVIDLGPVPSLANRDFRETI